MIEDVLRRFMDRHGLTGTRVIVAASGGADSTALLLALHDLGLCEVIAGHVNHHLRGAESDGDEAFVRTLAERMNVPVWILDGTLEREAVRRHGIEGAARAIRYSRLAGLKDSLAARAVATAHHQDDQAETVLMRLITGSGIAGLQGIHEVRSDGFIRPLLEVPHAALVQYVQSRGIEPRSDSSNSDLRFLRNRVRAALGQFGPETAGQIAGIAAQAAEHRIVLERVIDEADLYQTTADETRFTHWPADRWLVQALLLRHIRRLDPGSRDVSAADLSRLVDELPTLTRRSVTRTLELIRRGDAVLLRKVPEAASDWEFPLAPGDGVPLPVSGARIHVDRAEWSDGQPYAFKPRRQKFVLPQGANPSFLVRNRRPGDRFQPLGFPHEKKLKDVLIDRKIDAEVRDRIPLLVWDGSIVWVSGVEVSERFRLGSASGDVYEVWIEDEDREDDRG